MSSHSSHISFRPRSLSGVVDVIESYRRAQVYLSDSVSASASGTSDEEDFERQGEAPIEEEDDVDIENTRRINQPYDDVVSNLQWDEDLTPGPSRNVGIPTHSSRPFLLPVPSRRSTRDSSTSIQTSVTPTPKAEERTPLLSASNAESYLGHSARIPAIVETAASAQTAVSGAAVVRKPSQLSVHRPVAKVKAVSGGHSTTGQTVN